jgi:uncharacterized protein (TIGR00645 family)
MEILRCAQDDKQGDSKMPRNPVERVIERGLLLSRWLMAPCYMGLALTLFFLLYIFAMEMWHVLEQLPQLGPNEVILAILSLIDLTLAGNLVLIVIFSGYENFVSKIETDDDDDKFDWKGKVDFSTLKLKLIASIVAISGIHLLKIFMDINKYTDRDVQWMIIIHVVFVASGVMLALMDRVAKK